VPLLKNASSF